LDVRVEVGGHPSGWELEDDSDSSPVVPVGVTLDSLGIEAALAAKGLDPAVVSAACEAVLDEYDNCMDCVFLPKVLLFAGVPPLTALDLVSELAKLKVGGGLQGRGQHDPLEPVAWGCA
jgi:hypothetical protein